MYTKFLHVDHISLFTLNSLILLPKDLFSKDINYLFDSQLTRPVLDRFHDSSISDLVLPAD